MKKIIKYIVLFLVIVIGVMVIMVAKEKENKELSLEIVNKIVQSEGVDQIGWTDFEKYDHSDVGSGNYVYQFPLKEGGYFYLSGPSLDKNPVSIFYIDQDGIRHSFSE